MSTTAPPPATEEAERTARHLRICREMADLAIGLARAAAARAERDLATKAASPELAETDKLTPRNTPAAALLFARLCQIINNAIVLEARLAKGLSPTIAKPRPAAAPASVANAPLATANPLSPTAAALAASTSLSTLPKLPWQPTPNRSSTTPTP